MKPRRAAQPKVWRLPETVKFGEALKSHQSATFAFINTELEVAETFLDLAETSSSSDRRERNMQNAERAYASAVYFTGQINGNLPESGGLRLKLERVKKMLDSIGR